MGHDVTMTSTKSTCQHGPYFTRFFSLQNLTFTSQFYSERIILASENHPETISSFFCKRKTRWKLGIISRVKITKLAKLILVPLMYPVEYEAQLLSQRHKLCIGIG